MSASTCDQGVGSDVTVVMPTMNRESMIGAALDSIWAQRVRPAAVIVVDDGSTDATADVARDHGAEVVVLPKNVGSGPARNAGVLRATTEWVAFLDSDDTWMPHHLEAALPHTAGHVLVAAPGLNDDGRMIGNVWARDIAVDAKTALIPGDLICTSGVLVRRDALVEAGLFRPLRRAQDLDMWIRVLELGTGLALGRPGFTYHVHAAQAINDAQLMRQCFTQIVDDCTTKPWFGPRDADRAWVRWHWDGMREAQAHRDLNGLVREAGWLGARPHTWPTLLRKLRERRRSRALESGRRWRGRLHQAR